MLKKPKTQTKSGIRTSNRSSRANANVRTSNRKSPPWSKERRRRFEAKKIIDNPHNFPANVDAAEVPFNTNTGTTPEPNLHNFSTGAVRSNDSDDVRFDLVCPTGLLRLAKIYREGAVKYGDTNYTKGIPISNLLNHGEKHLALWKKGDRSEDHLAKVAWAIFSIMHMQGCHHQITILGNQITDQVYQERHAHKEPTA